MSAIEIAGTTEPSSPAYKIRLTHPHPFIQRMMAPPPKPDQYGYARRDDWRGVDIRVCNAQKRVALFIMDRLFKAIEDKGWQVEVESYNRRGTFAVDRQDHAQIWIEEKHRQVEHIPTPKELKEKETWKSTRIPKWDQVPTGQLVLHPGGPVDISSEHAVNTLIAKSIVDLDSQIADVRSRRQASERIRHEEFLKEQAKQQERARVDAFHKAAHSLHEYRQAMEYIEEVRRFRRVPDDQRREGQTLHQWIEWAERQARRLHPLG
jgi:hypothetical protein